MPMSMPTAAAMSSTDRDTRTLTIIWLSGRLCDDASLTARNRGGSTSGAGGAEVLPRLNLARRASAPPPALAILVKPSVPREERFYLAAKLLSHVGILCGCSSVRRTC